MPSVDWYESRIEVLQAERDSAVAELERLQDAEKIQALRLEITIQMNQAILNLKGDKTLRADLRATKGKLRERVVGLMVAITNETARLIKEKRDMAPKVLNRSRHKIPPGAVYIGRPTKWGNPFLLGKDGSREEVIEKYVLWLKTQPGLVADARKELAGKHLVCWCAPLACHGHVLVKVANEQGGEDEH